MNSLSNSPMTQGATPLPVRGWMAFLTVLSLLFLPLHSNIAKSANSLTTFSAEYTVENDYITGGDATLSLLENEQGNFDFVLQTIPTGIFKWTGKGNIREHAVLPDLSYPFESSHYHYTDKGDADRSYQIKFNRHDNQFNLMHQGSTSTATLPPGTLDRLSATLVILHEFQTNPEFTSIETNILSGENTQKIVFTKQGSEIVKTGLGKKEAIRIHKEREGSNRKTIIWLAPMDPGGQVVPVKIEQYKRSKLTMRLVLTNFAKVE